MEKEKDLRVFEEQRKFQILMCELELAERELAIR